MGSTMDSCGRPTRGSCDARQHGVPHADYEDTLRLRIPHGEWDHATLLADSSALFEFEMPEDSPGIVVPSIGGNDNGMSPREDRRTGHG